MHALENQPLELQINLRLFFTGSRKKTAFLAAVMLLPCSYCILNMTLDVFAPSLTHLLSFFPPVVTLCFRMTLSGRRAACPPMRRI